MLAGVAVAIIEPRPNPELICLPVATGTPGSSAPPGHRCRTGRRNLGKSAAATGVPGDRRARWLADGTGGTPTHSLLSSREL